MLDVLHNVERYRQESGGKTDDNCDLRYCKHLRPGVTVTCLEEHEAETFQRISLGELGTRYFLTKHAG